MQVEYIFCSQNNDNAAVQKSMKESGDDVSSCLLNINTIIFAVIIFTFALNHDRELFIS